MQPKININRLKANLLEVGKINSGKNGYTRLSFSQEEKEALDWLVKKLEKLPVTVSRDSIGNVYGKWGKQEKPSIAFGSHIDTVMEGGLFDGALGVIVGLECIQTLYDYNYEPQIPLELICFVSEEIGALGSKAVSGLIEHSSKQYKVFEENGFTWNDILLAKRDSQDFKCFLELHVEQGGLLENNKKNIGIVTSINGYLRKSIKIKGETRHSGTTPMQLRKDALVDAAKLIQEVSERAKKRNILATIGELHVHPNLENVVPGNVELTFEIRDDKLENIMSFDKEIMSWLHSYIDADVSVIVEKYPEPMSPFIQSTVEEVCKSLNVPFQYMVSGANHDANSMAALTETGMIFVPSINGISHNPEEETSWEDIEQGTNVMLETILKLSKK